MKTEKVNSIQTISAAVLEMFPPILDIQATAENTNSNYSKVRLEPHVYIAPPKDGIWEFDMVGEVPPITDNLMCKVSASYQWRDFPGTVKGIKVYGASNSKIIKI